MKLLYVRLHEKGMQTSVGRLGDTLAAPLYDMSLVSNLRSIKVTGRGWDAPVFIPLERIANFQPDPDALTPPKKT